MTIEAEQSEDLFPDNPEVETTIQEWYELDFCQKPDEMPQRKFTLTLSYRPKENVGVFINVTDAHLSLQPPIVDTEFVYIPKSHVPDLSKALQNYVNADVSQN